MKSAPFVIRIPCLLKVGDKFVPSVPSVPVGAGLLLICLLLSACANPVNRKIATAYTEGCYGFQVIGKWPQAQRACERAARNAERGGIPASQIAPLWFEYGRVSGILCDYQQAELGLQQALQIETGIGGPVQGIQLELARLKFITGEIAESAEWYDAWWQSVPTDQAVQNPALAIEIYEEMAEVYELLDDQARADMVRNNAESLRSRYNPGFSLSDVTPYGSVCY